MERFKQISCSAPALHHSYSNLQIQELQHAILCSWGQIMAECAAADVLGDEYLLDKVVNLIIGISWCAFCHYACPSCCVFSIG